MDKAILAVSGIYAITNKIDGKMYIGSAKILCRRVAQHKLHLSGSRHHSTKLQRAWDKHGPDAFVFSILEVVIDPMELIAREQHWMDLTNAAVNGYNIRPTAGSSLGYRHSAESNAKRSASLIGRARHPDVVARMKGKKQSPEWIEKRRVKRIGRKSTPEQVEKNRVTHLGKKLSLETIRKRTESWKANRLARLAEVQPAQ